MDSRSFRGGGTYRLGARFTPGVKLLIGLFGATWLLTNLGRVAPFVSEYLVLRHARALGPMPWHRLTGPALETDLIGLLFTALVLWSLGSAVEQQLGTRRFLR